MAEVLTMHRVKQAIFFAVAAALLFASGMMVQNSQAQSQPTAEDLDAFFFEAVQIDFICVNFYTARDRHVFSLPLISVLGEGSGEAQAGNFGYGLCNSGERLKIMFSINPYLMPSPA